MIHLLTKYSGNDWLTHHVSLRELWLVNAAARAWITQGCQPPGSGFVADELVFVVIFFLPNVLPDALLDVLLDVLPTLLAVLTGLGFGFTLRQPRDR